MDTLAGVRAVVVAAQVRILPVVSREIFWSLDAKTPTTMCADGQALQQVNAGCLLVSLHDHTATGAHSLTAIPQFLGDDRLVLSFRYLRRRGAITDTLGTYGHAPVADLADKVGIAEHVPHRVLIEHAIFRGEITLFVQPGSNLLVRIQPG